QVAHAGAAQRPGERRAPADEALPGILLVVTDQRDGPLLVVLVGDGHRRAEPDAGPVRLGCRVDDAQGLHPPGEVAQLAVDLAHALAAIEIVAVFGTVAIAGRPADDLDDFRAFRAQQMVIARAQ